MSYDMDAYRRAADERACIAARIVEHARWLADGAELTTRERARIGELIAEYDRHHAASFTALRCKP